LLFYQKKSSKQFLPTWTWNSLFGTGPHGPVLNNVHLTQLTGQFGYTLLDVVLERPEALLNGFEAKPESATKVNLDLL
jgi:hypothetical protein